MHKLLLFPLLVLPVGLMMIGLAAEVICVRACYFLSHINNYFIKPMRRISVPKAKNERNHRTKCGLILLLGFLVAVFASKRSQGRVNRDLNEAMSGLLDTLEGVGGTYSTLNQFHRHPSSQMFDGPLSIPKGEAQALPSLRVESLEEEVQRGIYGGMGDQKHLGGFTTYDREGVSPAVWKTMVADFGIKSIMDVGCGKGISSLWFHLHGLDTLCVEGSHDAVKKTLLPYPETQVIEHDFSRGPYWPAKTYDAVWSVEFLEHVGRNFQYNYVQAFRKAALIFASHSQWGGWHHVEVHDGDWWIAKFESFGFKYSASLTEKVKKIAMEEKGKSNGPDGQPMNAQHIWLNMQVFINPMVASLPEHAHLFSEHGCFKERGEKGTIIHKECGTLRGGKTESKLPDNFYPLSLTPEQDEAWLQQVQRAITVDMEHATT